MGHDQPSKCGGRGDCPYNRVLASSSAPPCPAFLKVLLSARPTVEFSRRERAAATVLKNERSRARSGRLQRWVRRAVRRRSLATNMRRTPARNHAARRAFGWSHIPHRITPAQRALIGITRSTESPLARRAFGRITRSTRSHTAQRAISTTRLRTTPAPRAHRTTSVRTTFAQRAFSTTRRRTTPA